MAVHTDTPTRDKPGPSDWRSDRDPEMIHYLVHDDVPITLCGIRLGPNAKRYYNRDADCVICASMWEARR